MSSPRTHRIFGAAPMLSVALTLLTLTPMGQAAQAPPNLSGTWRPQNPATARATDPFELTITQTPDAVTLRVPLQTPESVTLKTDGLEARAQGAGPGGPATTISRAAWEGAKLAVSTTVTIRECSGLNRTATHHPSSVAVGCRLATLGCGVR